MPAGTKLGIQIMCCIGKPAIKTQGVAGQQLLATATDFISAIADVDNELHCQVNVTSIDFVTHCVLDHQLQRVPHRPTPHVHEDVAMQNHC